MELTVRPARAADGDAVAAIYNQGIEERQATFETRPRTGAECAEQIGSDAGTLVAELGGGVVGWAGIVPYSPRAAYAGVGEFSIYVDRGGRGAGVGRRLLEELCAHAEALGYHKLLSKIFPAKPQAARAQCRIETAHGAEDRRPKGHIRTGTKYAG